MVQIEIGIHQLPESIDINNLILKVYIVSVSKMYVYPDMSAMTRNFTACQNF